MSQRAEELQDAADEYRHHLVPLLPVIRLVDVERLTELRNIESRMHGWLPIVDPTAYRDHITNPLIDDNLTIINAFLAFRKVIDPILDRQKEMVEEGQDD
jgi:hypothetical protein